MELYLKFDICGENKYKSANWFFMHFKANQEKGIIHTNTFFVVL